MSEKDWYIYHYNMLKRCEKILSICEGRISEKEFFERGILYDALTMNLQIIGENASKIPLSVREEYIEIPWKRIIFLRHIISHDYDSLEDNSLWKQLLFTFPS
jgi:uncharacterized protein with HEPN domain